MIFDELVLHNFGVYGGRQSVSLAPPSRRRPVVLFGGLNGGGKTTLMDALQLALYGKLARCSNRGTTGYGEFLRNCIHQNADPNDGAALEIQFRLNSEGKEHTYRVHRSWSASNGSGARERLEVARDGKLDPVLTDAWGEHVEGIVPNQISPLFFFDGEKIEQLADLDQSAEVLSTAIQSLLGMDLVDRLVTDLTVLERRKRAQTKDKVERERLEALEAEASRLSKRKEELSQEAAAARNELDAAEKKLKKIETEFQAQGGDLFERREALERDRQHTLERLQLAEDELRALASDASPLLLVPGLLDALRSQDNAELRAAEAQALSATLELRDRDVLTLLERSDVDSEVLRDLQGFLEQDRARRREDAKVDGYLHLTADARARVEEVHGGQLDAIGQTIKAKIGGVEELTARLDQLDRQLASVPDRDAIASLLNERAKARARVEEARARVQGLDGELERLRKDLEAKQLKLSKEYEKTAQAEFAQEDIGRILTHSARARESVKRFRDKVVERHVSQIGELVLDCFRQLLRKKSLLGGLEIDPKTFAVQLADHSGKHLPAERLSAGERQLLAVSLLWGLARASGRPLPSVIDTPLGRLDSEHRQHLVQRYFPYASHQVLLLSTDEEIDEQYYPSLQKWVGREYLLEFDDRSQRTTVREGYFQEAR